MRKITEKKFRRQISGKFKALEPYKNGRTQIAVECLTCGYKWAPVARNLIKGYGCPECGKKKAAAVKKWDISQGVFLNKIPTDLLAKIEVKSEYKHQHCDISVVCKTCRREWVTTPYKLYRNYGCDTCFRKRKGIASRKRHKEFVEQVFASHGDAIEVLGQYKTRTEKVKVRCCQCGHIWYPRAYNIQRDRGCPRCCDSKGEKRIDKILREAKIDYKREYVTDLRSPDGGCLRFDFAVFKSGALSHLIEYDGRQHFAPQKYMGGEERYKKQKRNDGLKNEYCQRNGIKLVRIPYTEYRILGLEMLIGVK